MTEIKAGNCYMCLKDKKGYDSFTKGKIYVSLYDNALINDNHIEVKVMPSECFRIATNDEIKAQKGEKVMTQEEKAKTYDETLERAKECLKDGTITTIARDYIWEIFPELKESEDESIRKELIEQVAYIIPYDDEVDSEGDALSTYQKRIDKYRAWLEKQGEKKSREWHSEDEQNLNVVLSFIEDEYLRRWLKDIIHAKYEQCAGCINDMKETKVEPKFKVGDWISGYYTNYKVTAINSKGYVVEDTDGNKINILFENEKFHHLWTIQDAEDGDVLSGETDGEVFIFLFNQIQDKWIVAHGYYSETDGEFIEKAYFHRHQGNLFSPATKEQRDTLFAKMKEAGYEWDSDKKELKKIEATAWSEEDEKIALSIEQVMNCASLLNIVPDEIERVRTWLKILKQRI